MCIRDRPAPPQIESKRVGASEDKPALTCGLGKVKSRGIKARQLSDASLNKVEQLMEIQPLSEFVEQLKENSLPVSGLQDSLDTAAILINKEGLLIHEGMEVLFDGGSDTSMVKRKWMLRADAEFRPTSINISGYNNSTTSFREIGFATLGIGLTSARPAIRRIGFCILPDHAAHNFDMLLGQDALRAFGLVIDHTQGLMWYRPGLLQGDVTLAGPIRVNTRRTGDLRLSLIHI